MRRVCAMLICCCLPLLVGQGCPLPGQIAVTDDIRPVCSWSDERILMNMREWASLRDVGMPYAMTMDLARGDCAPLAFCAEPCLYTAEDANRCDACQVAIVNKLYYGAP